MIGQQTFDAAGKRWTLYLGNEAQCAVEAHYDKGFFAVVADAMPNVDAETAMAVAQAMSTGTALPPAVAERAANALRGMRLSVLRDLAYYGLLEHHPSITLRDVSRIIDKLGHEAFGDLMRRAIEAAQGKPQETEGGAATKGNVRPATQPKRQTGKPSSRSGRSSG